MPERWLTPDHSLALIHGKAEDLLPTFKAEQADAIVTDPPYGLEFMGKEWDRFSGAVADRNFKDFTLSQQRTRNVKCPDCHKWAYDHPGRLCECGGIRRAQGNVFQAWCESWAAECLRILKPGGYMLVFGGTRTYHRLACGIEDAGFEIRDSLHWLYGTGFPKSKACLKPAHEPIILARKPGKGMSPLNLDGCKVLHASAADLAESRGKNRHQDFGSGPRENNVLGDMSQHTRADQGNYDGSAGRWPPNVLLTHSPDCAELCEPDCPAGLLDRQSGITRSTGGSGAGSGKIAQSVYGSFAQDVIGANAGGLGDAGGASRFFPVFRYQAKAGAKERPYIVIDGKKLKHPTVKPVALMQWLIRLITPPGGVILDPFAGTGTTGQAALAEGIKAILIEQLDTDQHPYIRMARKRLGI